MLFTFHNRFTLVQQSPGSIPGGGRGTFKMGYIVFSDEAEVTAAIHMTNTPSTIPCPIVPVGMAKWARDYAVERPSLKSMEEAVEAEVREYDRRKAEEEEKRGRKRVTEADADGWITVTKRRAVAHVTRKEKRRKKQNELLNFYAFQQREGQREKVAELRKKFEQDKERVAEMKARRKFKPF